MWQKLLIIISNKNDDKNAIETPFWVIWNTKRCQKCDFCLGRALKAPPLLVGLILTVKLLLNLLCSDKDDSKTCVHQQFIFIKSESETVCWSLSPG